MNKLISLIKTDLNITFGISSLKYSIRNKKKRWTYVIIAVALLSLIPSYVMMIQVLKHLYSAFRQIGQQSYFLMMGIMISQFMVFFLGLLYTMGKYYFSRDFEQLLPLPIRPSIILGSRFATLVVSEYIVSLPIALPFVVIFGIREFAGPLYWIISSIVLFLLPLIPLSAATIIIMVFMKYTNLKGRKDLVRTIGGLLIVILIVFLQMKFNQLISQGVMDSESFLFDLARDSQLLVKKLGRAYPPAMWAATSMVGSIQGSWTLSIFGYTAASIFGTVTAVILSEGLYMDGLLGSNEVPSKTKSMDSGKLEKISKIRKPWLAIAHKEIMMLFKTPIYLMNSVGGVVIVPILLVMSLLTSGSDMEVLRGMLQGNELFVDLGGAGMLTLLGMLNSIGVTTFSREGKNLWIQRTLPIKAREQIMGRLLASMAIQGLGAIFLLVSLCFILPLSLFSIAYILVVGGMGSILMSLLGMTIDIMRPMRDWTNPQQAMKQNLNVLIGMGTSLVILGPLVYLVYLSHGYMPDFALLIGIPVLFMSLSTLDYRLLHSLVDRQLAELED